MHYKIALFQNQIQNNCGCNTIAPVFQHKVWRQDNMLDNDSASEGGLA